MGACGSRASMDGVRPGRRASWNDSYEETVAQLTTFHQRRHSDSAMFISFDSLSMQSSEPRCESPGRPARATLLTICSVARPLAVSSRRRTMSSLL